MPAPSAQAQTQPAATLLAGSASRHLAQIVGTQLDTPFASCTVERFPDGEVSVRLDDAVRGTAVILLAATAPPVNDHLVELLMMLDTARSAGAQEVNAIIPYFSFARSDKKDAPRICITARLVADLIKSAGATHAMTMMLHSPQVHGFFSIPTDPLTSRPVFKHYFQQRDLTDTIVVAPDMGHAKSAARFARELGLPVAAGNKERLADDRVRITGIVGEQVRGCERALIYDDEIATGGSILEMSRLLVQRGVREVWVTCTHGVFSRNAVDRLAEVPEITDIVTTDTVYIPPEKRHPKLHVLSSAPLFGEAIRANCNRQPIGQLLVFADE